jgi:hypothetical protein
MKILEFIFHLGVVFAVFGFLWWIFTALLSLLRGGRTRTSIEVYSLKLVNYFFLVSVTARFSADDRFGLRGSDDLTGMVIGGMVLLMFLLGKVQKKEQQIEMLKTFQHVSPLNARMKPVFNRNLEILMLFVALGFYGLFTFLPETAYNPVTNWFVDSIVNIVDTPVFGFIFKVIGFFFLLGVLFRFIGGILSLLGLRPPSIQSNSYFHTNREGKDKDKKEDDFDDYEEIK